MSKKKPDQRDIFLGLILESTKKVLDVGCSGGDLGAKLQTRGIEVIGVEKDRISAEKARDKLKQVFCADIEEAKLPFPSQYFDCIMYADVLEHLNNPLAILKKHRELLGEKGCILASMPNIRYYKVIIRLVLGGTWDYSEGGILDRTHLRFFTLINMLELLEEAGYKILEIKRNIVAARWTKLLNFLCFNVFKEFLTYQYYIMARKSDEKTFTKSKRKIYKF